MMTTHSNEMMLMTYQADLAAHVQWLKEVADGKRDFYAEYINEIVKLLGIDAALIYFRDYERTLQSKMLDARITNAEMQQEINQLKHALDVQAKARNL